MTIKQFTAVPVLVDVRIKAGTLSYLSDGLYYASLVGDSINFRRHGKNCGTYETVRMMKHYLRTGLISVEMVAA